MAVKIALAVAAQIFSTALAVSAFSADTSAELFYPQPRETRDTRIDWLKFVTENLPVLEHPRRGRWPLVLFEGFGFRKLDAASLRSIAERGFLPHYRLNERDIDAAASVQGQGLPVIIMEGKGGQWPYDVQDRYQWKYVFGDAGDLPREWLELADSTQIQPWKIESERIRSTLEEFKQRGVRVDAVWLDYEGALVNNDFAILRYYHRHSLGLPFLDGMSAEDYRRYQRREWLSNLSDYVAAPIRQVFPEAAATNWVVMLSSRLMPVYSWTNWRHPSNVKTDFNYSNPIAYGMDIHYRLASRYRQINNQRDVDLLYMGLLLRQVSADAYNRKRRNPEKGAVVWVARWVKDLDGQNLPMMSRSAYRETLRHLWLRGIDGMQIFNPPRPSYLAYAKMEVEDVQTVYREILRYRELLNDGRVINYRYGKLQEGSVLWSGLRTRERAVIRLIHLGRGERRVKIPVWPNRQVWLQAETSGAYHIIDR